MDVTRKCGPQSGAQAVQILSAGSCAPDLACRRGAAVALRHGRRGVPECWLVACWMKGAVLGVLGAVLLWECAVVLVVLGRELVSSFSQLATFPGPPGGRLAVERRVSHASLCAL